MSREDVAFKEGVQLSLLRKKKTKPYTLKSEICLWPALDRFTVGSFEWSKCRQIEKEKRKKYEKEKKNDQSESNKKYKFNSANYERCNFQVNWKSWGF